MSPEQVLLIRKNSNQGEKITMKYMVLFYSPVGELEREHDDPTAADHWESWRTYMDAIYTADIVESGNALKPPHTATTVRIRDGKRQVQDGPYADTKELLGGYLIIDVPTLDDALHWAERSPSSLVGRTEIWPVLLFSTNEIGKSS